MPLSLTDIVLGVVLPVLASACLTLLAGRPLSARWAGRLPVTACAVAIVIGIFALRLAPLQPESHWHWLPWLLLGSAIPACLPTSHRRWSALRWTGNAALLALAAFLLVPDWDDLIASRTVLQSALFAVMLANAAAFSWLVQDDDGMWAIRQLVGGAFLLSVLLLLSGSLRFTQVALCGLGAFAGLFVAEWTGARMSIRALAVPAGLLFAGLALVGQVNSYSSIPAAAYVPLAVFPLVVATCAGSRRRSGMFTRICVSELPTVIALAAAAWAAYAEYGP